MGNPRFKLGRYFTVPLSDGSFAHGYFTEVDNGQMYLTAIHRLRTRTAELPSDIEDVPLAIRCLRIGGSEFLRRKPHEWPYFGQTWILTKHFHSGDVEPFQRYFIMGSNWNPRVWDVLREEPMRPATEEERASLKPVGFDLQPGPCRTIEKALSDLAPRE